MRLLQRKKNTHKNTYGHALILAGSRSMLGAGALCSLAALRSGCGLVTWGIPQSLNLTAQTKCANEIMTLSLKETMEQSLALTAWAQIRRTLSKYNAIAIGPGLSTNLSTTRFILKIIKNTPIPLIIDADALNSLKGRLNSLTKTKTPKILTPHPGEMARMTGEGKTVIERNRLGIAQDFAQQYQCVLLLKGHHTVVSDPAGEIYINKTGNPGMATAGSGDVLTGIISALLTQGLSAFDAAKYGAFIHGQAGDLAAQAKTQTAMIASDIVSYIPESLTKQGLSDTMRP